MSEEFGRLEQESGWFLLRPLLDDEKKNPDDEEEEYEIIDGNGKLKAWREL